VIHDEFGGIGVLTTIHEHGLLWYKPDQRAAVVEMVVHGLTACADGVRGSGADRLPPKPGQPDRPRIRDQESCERSGNEYRACERPLSRSAASEERSDAIRVEHKRVQERGGGNRENRNITRVAEGKRHQGEYRIGEQTVTVVKGTAMLESQKSQ
jgi:hypothetical protein